MQLGVEQYSYHRYFGEVYGAHKDPGVRWDLNEFISEVNHLPIEALSLETCFLPSSDEEIFEAVSNLEYDVLFSWGHPSGFMELSEDETLRQVERFLALSRSLGSHVLRIAGSSIAYFNQPHRPQIDLTIERLSKLLPLAHEYDVLLALENHGDFYIEELKEILERTDSTHVGLTLDTGNLIRMNEDPSIALQVFKKKVILVHAKDVALIPGYSPDDPRRFECVPAGRGVVNFRVILSELREQNYNGAILLEISGVHPDYALMSEQEMLSEGLEFLHHLIDESKS